MIKSDEALCRWHDDQQPAEKQAQIVRRQRADPQLAALQDAAAYERSETHAELSGKEPSYKRPRPQAARQLYLDA